jgi:hypothetical protein
MRQKDALKYTPDTLKDGFEATFALNRTDLKQLLL